LTWNVLAAYDQNIPDAESASAYVMACDAMCHLFAAGMLDSRPDVGGRADVGDAVHHRIGVGEWE
jgi:hypothetical protein